MPGADTTAMTGAQPGTRILPMTAQSFPPTVFQSFEEKAEKCNVAPRLAALRGAMTKTGVDGFLIPRADAHRGESVPASEARLAWVTGFTGSAGLALVGKDKAGLFIDSRYTLQAPAQTDTDLITVIQTDRGGLNDEAKALIPEGGKIAYDSWLHTPGEVRETAKLFDGHATLVSSDNLVDSIWSDRPAAPVSAIEFLGHNRAGQTAGDKIAEIQASLASNHADAAVLTLPESICWLFNMRGRDVPNTPFVLGFAVVPQAGQPTLYLDAAKITDELRQSLSGIAGVESSADLGAALKALGESGKAVLIDPASAPDAVAVALKDAGAKLIEKRDPVILPKSRKNPAELAGMHEAHTLDGVALAKFLAWFYDEAPKGTLTEIGIVTALEAFRREEESCVDASFDTISGSGPNGAIVHYRVSDKTDRRLNAGEIMLVDSGAQYLSGTTDITRTLSTGKPSDEQRDRYTRVLKGMIAISMARFPKGTSGAQLDVLARQFLWHDGVTYSHGTGHGVGAYLGVHEGPVGISPRAVLPLELGNVISNEPGYYKTGEYGIRIENLITVVESEGFPGFLEFQTLTLAPIDTRLIRKSLLSEAERAWLDDYHQMVWQAIGPKVKGKVRDWLKEATVAL
ncbi:Xaa-Pro aminopeptidase [Devosia sp. YR412]|uniref:aminopeptidase P family protein n=1 Tax=Devosia sp. YR412 TaxID=1881030 RepID=UPI0008BF6CE0|nr:aminopeptidase P family protein [Devosia sp. YR412]SEQ00886.1 Xaa-Pro aminopeptidase [Devosia sp. YR412]